MVMDCTAEGIVTDVVAPGASAPGWGPAKSDAPAQPRRGYVS